ncbi:hypothetical protein NDU88_006556 [Pleurodeles waltl]|uniref:Uncharacterized protein n=1 Tax=Pleurodeles waltl TaxID=8319 RepID=A0AAV7M0I2_PLEWA|nr:hypothetical protein NDU88_006556 [Pleurodeles waltl]
MSGSCAGRDAPARRPGRYTQARGRARPPAHRPHSQAAVRSVDVALQQPRPGLKAPSSAVPPSRRLNPDCAVTSRGSQTGPLRCRVCAAPTSARPVCFPGSGRRPRLTPSHSTGRHGTSRSGVQASRGHPWARGRSFHVVVPTRDQDKLTKGGL